MPRPRDHREQDEVEAVSVFSMAVGEEVGWQDVRDQIQQVLETMGGHVTFYCRQ